MPRTRSAPGDSMWDRASIATCPRRAWIQAAEAKVAPISRKVLSSSCQSLGMLKKYRPATSHVRTKPAAAMAMADSTAITALIPSSPA